MKGVKQPMYIPWNKGNVPYWLREDDLTSHSLHARLFDKADEQAIFRLKGPAFTCYVKKVTLHGKGPYTRVRAL